MIGSSILATSALLLAVALTGLWMLSLALRDVSIVDIFWGLGFVLVAWTAYACGAPQGRSLLPPVLATVWGVRLAGYLAWRNLGHGEDYRYRSMRQRIGRRFPLVSLFTVFLLQGVLVWVVSLPLQLVQRASIGDQLKGLVPLGLVLYGAGLFFETVGDWQLARFKADPAHAGQVMDQGLWRYTRHPNYFGDFIVWWGLFAVAVGLGAPLYTVVGPAIMSWLLLRVSGVPLLERALKTRRPDYEQYIRRTSSFFPRPPRP